MLDPPPPIPPRARPISTPAPPIGWNLPGMESWGGQNTDSTQSSVAPAVPLRRGASINSGTYSAPRVNNDLGTRAKSLHNSKPANFGVYNQSTLRTQPVNEMSLMSMSPSNHPGGQTFNTAMDFSAAEPQTYSVDLEGLDFSASDLRVNVPPQTQKEADQNLFKYDHVKHDFKEPGSYDRNLKAADLKSDNSGYGWNSCFLPPASNLSCNNPWLPTGSNSQNSHYNMHHTGHQPPSWQAASKPTHAWGINNVNMNTSNFNSNFGTNLTVHNDLSRQLSSDFARLRSNSPNPDTLEDLFCSPTPQTQTTSNTEQTQLNSVSSDGSDLMQFSPLEEKEYLSLDFFDPLHQRARSESVRETTPKRSYSVAAEDGSTDDIFSHESNVPPGASAADVPSLYPVVGSGLLYPVGDLQSMGEDAAREDELERFLQTAPQAPPPPKEEVPVKKAIPTRPEKPSKVATYERLRQRLFVDDESDAFCQMVAK